MCLADVKKKAQECDATMLNRIPAAGLKKIPATQYNDHSSIRQNRMYKFCGLLKSAAFPKVEITPESSKTIYIGLQNAINAKTRNNRQGKFAGTNTILFYEKKFVRPR